MARLVVAGQRGRSACGPCVPWVLFNTESPLMMIHVLRLSSWQGLALPSTSLPHACAEDVYDRHMAGHEG
jgi:hypothetical protein